MTQTQPSSRHILWRTYCPRCVTRAADHEHFGLGEVVKKYACQVCRKPFVVTSNVDGSGRPLCKATPVFVKAPEVFDDNDPPPIP